MAKGRKNTRTDPWKFISSAWPSQVKYFQVAKDPSNETSKEENRSSVGRSALSRVSLLVPKKLRHENYEAGREWTRGTLLWTYGVGAILVLNIIVTVIASTIGEPSESGFMATSIYRGSCSVSSHWTTGIHAFINILSTLLLAGSNYTMQCLAAPSRADIDSAHQRRRWLDIGVFNIRNLSVMSKRQRVLWGLLLLSSTPIHMIYNSVVFSTVAALDYATVLIPDNLSDEPLTTNKPNFATRFFDAVGTSAIDIHAEILNGTYKEVSGQECLETYNIEFNTNLGTLLAVSDHRNFHNTTVLLGKIYNRVKHATKGRPFVASSLYGIIQYTDDPQEYIDAGRFSIKGLHFEYQPWKVTVPNPAVPEQETSFELEHEWNYDKIFFPLASQDWISDVSTLYGFLITYNPDKEALNEYLSTPENWKNDTWATNTTLQLGNDSISGVQMSQNIDMDDSFGYVPVMRCMIKKRESLCQLTFSPLIATVVIISILIKVVCMFLTARTKRKDILLTVGDAISSFLANPDTTTQDGRHRSDLHDEWRAASILSSPGQHDGYSSAVELSQGRKKRWYQAVSGKRWTGIIIFFIFCEAFSIWMVRLAYKFRSIDGSFSAAWKIGFGKFDGRNLIASPGISQNTISLLLLANTPQVVLSILYFLYNSLLTTMAAAAEYNNYALQRKPLRVSWPKGHQRSTYYLSLPYRYSLPLLVTSAALHWLLSQSIFFVNVAAYDVHEKPVAGESIKGCGFAPLPMMVILLVSVLGAIALLVLSFRSFKSPMPLAVRRSASISAACHPPRDDCDSALKPVMWGELVSPDTGRRCRTFTSKDVGHVSR
ncbi:hypothetical protein P170DRAFT_417088 [Aspergillus steynii IBT 23096]|uniref:DUF6536 domain-containing protein n=1 Tax=Aspergillus steynii IBT 23096 TaxID=1392250 RepID=A0A2I2FV16_9EURO|nr:uncharacterized protein P170DRAFT_417088 [Aspergillus steynii IBT 23096]PLB44451.1 hypothetical protein P170DRAFT_417088 [Aspergillus steynii IBT 23096]